MIRGISRQIIEVQKLGNEYFERALFFVNPVFSDAERSVLELSLIHISNTPKSKANQL